MRRTSASSSSSLISSMTGRCRDSTFCSSERTAFIRPPSKVEAMAMTSPVAFICVPSARLAVANLSKGHLGILTTM